MRDRLCALCGSTLAPGRDDGPLVFLGGHGLPVYTEPPQHRSCAAYALRACPVLALAPPGDVIVTEAREFTLLEQRATALDEAGDPIGRFVPHGRPGNKRLGLLGYFAAHPHDPTRYRRDEWLRQATTD